MPDRNEYICLQEAYRRFGYTEIECKILADRGYVSWRLDGRSLFLNVDDLEWQREPMRCRRKWGYFEGETGEPENALRGRL